MIRLTIVTCMVCMLYAMHPAQSQDPLGKPDVWSELKENPQNISLWAEYLEKSLGEIEDRHLQDILKWSKMLCPEGQQLAIGNVMLWYATQAKKDDLKSKMEAHLFHKELEEEVSHEALELGDLTEDIEGNFIIIEDKLRQAYAEMGVQYQPFDKVYPGGNYSKFGWIDDKRQELKQLKMLNVRLLIVRDNI